MAADAIVALFQAIPALSKLAGDIVSASDTAKSNAQLIQFQQALIGLNSMLASVQQENTTLTQQKRDAEEELKRMKDWETEKQRYKMASPNAGSFVYAVKREMSNGEPPHYLCANCFKQGKPSLVNDVPSQDRRRYEYCWFCPNCESSPLTGLAGPSVPKYAEDFLQEPPR